METLSAGRRWAALFALALGGFGLGLTEFVAMGLLPEIARDLLPLSYARSAPDAVATAGWMITTYALGVVVGAPTIAALTARVPRRRLLVGLLGLFVIGTLASAIAPTFGLVMAGRFVSGLAHGAYFGAAGIVAANILGPGNYGKGFAIVLSGLTGANVFGVPLITALGQAQGWRVAYLAVAGVFVLTLLAVLATVPPVAAAPGGSPRAELRSFRSPHVWLVALVVAVGSSGFFAVISYVSPVTTHVTGLSSNTVPWVMAVMGCGMTAGILTGGFAADRDLRRSVVGGFAGIVVTIGLFAVVAQHPVGLFVAAFLVGAAACFIGPAIQTWLISVTPGAQLMGAAVNQSAGNIANSAGAALGGAAISLGWGYLGAAWIGFALAAAGLVLAAVTFSAAARPAPALAPEHAGV
ncbi:DHA1 family inner membrane transport protein [Actinoplanes lutulentus]|uniref:DHA1 family inner membrane transport protein n=1 Tax=Actinoplanes lutulentus TaxID=1287878 RepID=A0A327YXJ1_9ACTN|nr:MFS transporter [Actinoplanes lutulentus]MBB2947114.1 DHA1 family inner membrane transport protein [Actinoplanes lutulentus]RAK24680.1 DHA1 family inner membrane transport protein [Actinoplanes lutulentus]